MGGVRRYKVQTPNAHPFHPCFANAIHENQGAIPFDGSVKFRAITLQVEVPVSHEVLQPDLARFDDGASPELTAFRAFGDRAPSLNLVHYGRWIHSTKSFSVCKNSVQLPESLRTLEHLLIGLKQPTNPVHLHHLLTPAL
jgi:hypothetical protein